MLKRIAQLVAVFSLVVLCDSHAGYKPVKSRKLKKGEVAVTGPGSYAKAGTTYVLTKDITSPRSAIFLGNNVTLDLNGYTITYADGYKHLPNYDFAGELQGWDISKAPGAKVKNTKMIHPMVGDNSLVLPQGEEIVSEYITLPEANRAYYAMVSAASHQMHFGIYIEDEQGKTVECVFKFGNNSRPCAPEKRRCTKLGGGTVFALMFGKPAGKYRVRVKAIQRDCIIGAVDLLPALDVGVGIVEKTSPWAYYKCIFDGDSTAFFDYTEKGSTSKPVASIPVVTGSGRIIIRNGTIKSGTANIRTWGIQSSAKGVKVDIENVKFVTTGINACAIRAPFGLLKDCKFELDYPFIIDRHGVRGDPVNYFARKQPTEITGCEFVGGQGCLVVSGKKSKVHHNIFKPKQTITNHYAVHVAADSSEVYDNEFAPIIGGGINIFYQRHVKIYNNKFTITSAPPNNEYGNADYSTNAIRITDYGASHGNKKGWCEDNQVYNNTFNITAKDYPGCHKNYKSMAYAIFMSVGGGAELCL